ncbi:MAG: hypothetical protein D6708_02695 [Candidatus Dadabacteria bacterium]|nr:MAG: hypothetical protein D6708_02695 [Candidatus Dadabacteria bacterium]
MGQDEVEIVDMAHSTAVVCLPGMGDDIQAMKAGILEIGDLFIVNKADRPGADEVVKQLSIMLEMRTAHDENAWKPPVLKTVAVKNEGIAEVVDAFFAHREHQEKTGKLAERKAKRQMHFFRELVKELAAERIFGAVEGTDEYARMLSELRARRLDPYSAAETLLDKTLGGG